MPAFRGSAKKLSASERGGPLPPIVNPWGLSATGWVQRILSVFGFQRLSIKR
jgi:hypothetical protein